jgi:hypothetical protein
MRSPRTVALVALAFLWGGCAQGLEVDTPMKVELDAFSGRPNPTWDLSSQEAAELEKRLVHLHPVEWDAPEPGLGYRGFLLSSPARQIRVYQGLLTVVEGGVTRRYTDANRIELWLAEQAKGRGYGNLVAGITG